MIRGVTLALCTIGVTGAAVLWVSSLFTTLTAYHSRDGLCMRWIAQDGRASLLYDGRRDVFGGWNGSFAFAGIKIDAKSPRGWHYDEASAPFSTLLVAISLPAIGTIVVRPLRRFRRRRKGLCIYCGYCLTGLTEPRCPECGKSSIDAGIDVLFGKTRGWNRKRLGVTILWAMLAPFLFVAFGLFGWDVAFAPKHWSTPPPIINPRQLSSGVRPTGGFPIVPPVADADPSRRQKRVLAQPTAIRMYPIGDDIMCEFDESPTKEITIDVGHRMIVGARTIWRVVQDGAELKGHGSSQLGGLDSFRSGSRLRNLPDRDDLIMRGTIRIFETDVPPQHFWSPESGKFRILWEKTFEANIPRVIP